MPRRTGRECSPAVAVEHRSPPQARESGEREAHEDRERPHQRLARGRAGGRRERRDRGPGVGGVVAGEAQTQRDAQPRRAAQAAAAPCPTRVIRPSIGSAPAPNNIGAATDRTRRTQMAVEVGSEAPDFTLRNEDGEEVTLSSLRGQNVVLVFYPLAFSAICTKELHDDHGARGQVRRRLTRRSSASRSTARSRSRRSSATRASPRTFSRTSTRKARSPRSTGPISTRSRIRDPRDVRDRQGRQGRLEAGHLARRGARPGAGRARRSPACPVWLRRMPTEPPSGRL